MTERRRGLGRGLGALIPSDTTTRSRPSDVFFADAPSGEEQDAPPEQAHFTDQQPAGERPDAGDGSARDGELAPVPGLHFTEVAIGDIVANRRQPRQEFDEEALAELAHSIAQIGLLQPVVVRPLGSDMPASAGEASPHARTANATDLRSIDERPAEHRPRFELIMGERRWRAARAAGLDRIPAIVKDTHDDDLLRDALLENLHRSQLNALEEAAAYQQLLQDFSCTHEDLAARLGRSRPHITNTIRLLNLPPLVGRRVAAGVLSSGHARALLGLQDRGAMERLAQRIVAEGLSVRAVEEIVATDDGAGQSRRRAAPTAQPKPELNDLAVRLSDRLDTRVTIAVGRRRGKLTVEFATVQDLDRILDVLDLGRVGDPSPAS